MPENRIFWGGVIVLALLFANIISWIFSGWGLITLQTRGMPLSKVIKSIEHQGWVTIYTDIDPNTQISMNVYKVPLAEAMESLAANVPPPDAPAINAAPGGGGGPGGGRRGFGGGAQWKMAFFAAGSSAQVREEVRTFQSGSVDDETKVYSYPTPLQMLATDASLSAADPRQQVWSGMPATPPPAAAPSGDGGAPGPPPDPPTPPSTVQDYLNALAQSADIWIMSPTTWTPKIAGPPSAGSSIAKAVKSLVGEAHGSVEQAFVLYQRIPGLRGGGGGRGFFGGDTGPLEDRMRNAINGLPAEDRPDALNQLNQEIAFQKQVQAAPPEQRRDMMRAHYSARMGAMDNWRRSPERRAQMYQHAVSNRQVARGK